MRCSLVLAMAFSATALLPGCRTGATSVAEPADAATALLDASASPSGDAGSDAGDSDAAAASQPDAVPPPLRAEIQALAAEMVARPVSAPLPAAAPAGSMLLYSYAFAGYALVNAALDDPSFTGEAAPLLDGIIDRAASPAANRPFGAEQVKVAGHAIARSVAPRGHLALLLAGRRLLAPLPAEREALLEAIAEGLAADIASASNHLLPTYGRRTWPADNEVVAAAFAILAGRAPGTPHVETARQLLQGSLQALESGGLPPSAVAPGALTGTDVSRGCALSWTIALRGLHDRESARRLYARYRDAYWVEVGPLGGFREWPPGVDRPADVDSGPIVMGVGAAATAFGIGAARAAGEPRDAAMLLATAEMGAIEHGTARGRSWLERAIELFARTARPWP
jgi:hypothetical protein